MKKVFDEAAEMQKKLGKPDEITPQDVDKSMQELFKLPLTGQKIHQLFKSQTQGRNTEHKLSEYLHQGVFKQKKNYNKNQKFNNAQPSGQRLPNQQNQRKSYENYLKKCSNFLAVSDKV